MNAKSKVVDPVRGTSTLVRPKFSEGLLLNDDDLTAGIDYTRDLSRLLFRSLFGCGVICGLVVKPEPKCEKLYIHIADGIALDCHGDPIQVPSPQTVTLDPKCETDIPPNIWVVLCRNDKCCAPRTAMCSCDDVDTPTVCTRIRDGFEIRVLPTRPGCACGCFPPKKSPHPGYSDPSQSQSDSQESLSDVFGVRLADNTTDSAGARNRYDCLCADPTLPCYQHHYAGDCSCECGDSCDCDCVILARLYSDEKKGWQADHSVRRFIRPVLMRDPQVALEQREPTTKTAKDEAEEEALEEVVEEMVEEIREEKLEAAKKRRRKH